MEQNEITKQQQDLFDALSKLRQKLKDREKHRTGRSPAICPDASLWEIIRLMPKKASDFFSVPGVGPAFVEHYAEDFLAVLAKYNQDEQSEKTPEKTTANTNSACSGSFWESVLVVPKLLSTWQQKNGEVPRRRLPLSMPSGKSRGAIT